MRDRTGWPILPLGELADTSLGKMLDRGKSRGLPLVPYLRNVNIQWGHVDTSDLLTMELADHERQRFGVEPGDLLVCEGGEVGRAAIWQGGTEYLAYQKAIHRVRSRGGLDLRFLRYLLEHYRNTGDLASRSTGSTIAHLPQERLRSLPIPYPELSQQLRVVSILEDHLSRLDAASSTLRSALRRTEQMILTDLAYSVTGAGFPAGSSQIKFGDISVALPEGWSVSTLAKLASRVEYGTSVKAHDDRGAEEIPVVRMGNIKNGYLDWHNLKFLSIVTHPDLPILAAGDLLFNRTNSAELVGKCAVVKAGSPCSTFASYLIRVQFCEDVLADWVAMIINSPYGRAYIKSVATQQVGQANVNGTKLKAFPIPVPPLNVHRTLVARHTELVDDARMIQGQITSLQKRQTVLRRAMLAAAFSGRLHGGSHQEPAIRELVGV